MKPGDKARLQGHVAQEWLARAAQAVAAVVGAAAWWQHGWPGALLGVALVWLFGLARPGPDKDLDNVTGRRD